jgi:hypothetical protein
MHVSKKLTILPGLSLVGELLFSSPFVFTERRFGETEWEDYEHKQTHVWLLYAHSRRSATAFVHGNYSSKLEKNEQYEIRYRHSPLHVMASSLFVVIRSYKAAGLFKERPRPQKRHFASINMTGK